MNKSVAALFVSLFLLGGCATIVGDETQYIPITSQPSDATVHITDETGRLVFKGMTPTSVMLPKSDGSYWGGKHFSVRIAKEGYETQTISIKAEANAWYIGGNIIFGGMIGWFIVDPFGGGMYTLSPESLDSSLLPEMPGSDRVDDGSISILLLEDVPTALRRHLQRVN